jgi:general secretion pathway protein G
VKNRRVQTRRAFTMVEAIVIIVILGIIAAVVAPRLLSRIGQGKQSVAKANAASLATAMKTFMVDYGRTPETGTPITVLIDRPSDMAESGWHGPYVDSADALNDPWGRPFILLIPGQKNHDFDIISYGADGQAGGDGENADIVAP